MRKSIIMLLLFVLWLSSCSKFDVSGEHAGTYELVTIDGNSLPYIPSHEGGAPEVLSATLTLNGDGSFQMSMTYRTSPGNSISRDFIGTYSLDEGAFRFEWEGAGVTSGSLDANTVTINNEGILFTYKK